ncbi:MAG TPA: NusG domain II-containing protein, partial [Coriobacteriia bacterium]|nr:NusG domain II-containing protein [Coriobacteriia bacterium]
LLSAPHALASLGADHEAVVVRGPEGVTTVPLADSARYVVPGHVGDVVVEVKDGAVRIVAADCPDHVCVRMGSGGPGRPLICAPNGVSVLTVADDAKEFDALSR